jgi:dienelactone hydrolase
MAADIRTETVTYTAGGATLVSYLAWDASQEGPRPGIVVFGEWWGLNDYQKRRARQLAELGYVALAADMYGDGNVAADATEAATLMNGLFADMDGTSAKVRAAAEQLARRPEADPARLGAMGYCLGGALALHAARLGLDLRGVASFHGSLGKTHPAQKGDVKARVLVCHGEDDSFVSAEEQAGFRQEMDDLGVDYKFVAYPGAKHGFTNPDATENGVKYNLPLAYNEDVDRESWQEMKAFWAEVLG